MNRERKLAHIVSYYLSRYDKQALHNLGYKTDKEAFNGIAEKLNLLPNYIKFRRDEFDVIHPHRKGWHKREMTPSVTNTINALQDLDELSLFTLVKLILNKETDSEIFEDLDKLTSIFPTTEQSKKNKSKIFYPRTITGKKAEELFINHFNSNNNQEKGELIDKRDFGVGYDFEIIKNEHISYIEVKGMIDINGGILFTSKEWYVAKEKGDDYYLCIISNVNDEATINFIQNPYASLNPNQNILQTIQVNYSVTKSDLQKVLTKTHSL